MSEVIAGLTNDLKEANEMNDLMVKRLNRPDVSLMIISLDNLVTCRRQLL